MTSPTERSLKLCRKLGWHVAVVERYNQFARVRQDLFGCIDLLAVTPTWGGVTGIQATSGDNVSKRMTKIEANPVMQRWLRAGNRVYVVGWSKRGKRGERKSWSSRWVEAKLEQGKITWKNLDGPPLTESECDSDA